MPSGGGVHSINFARRLGVNIESRLTAWRHGAAVDAFAGARREVLTAWDELREKTRTEGDAVALGDTYRETLDRHAALLRQAQPFRARPKAFTALLAERSGIRGNDLEAFEALHDRARQHRRAATMRQVHRTRREAEGESLASETRQGERALEGGRAEAPSLDRVETPVESAHTPPPPVPPKPDWWPAYESAVREWNALNERARQSGTLPFYAGGYAELILRMRALAENPDIPAASRAPMIRTLQGHEHHLAARKKVEDFLAGADRHMARRDALRDAAADADVAVAEAPNYRGWRREAERLVEEGEAILSDRETRETHLDNIVSGEVRARGVVHDLGEAIREDDEELAQARREAREQRRLARQSDRLKLTTGTSAVTAQAEPARKVLWQLRRVYDWDGRAAERDRQALALERWETLKENWNRQVERAGEEGVHVIYAKGYKKLRQELTAMADDDLYLGERANSELRAVILRLERAEEGRAHVEKHRDLIAGRLGHRREVLQFGDSWDKRAVPDREHYEAWRDGTDEAAAAAEGVLANRRKYGIHLDGMAHRGEGLASALSRVRQALADDDRHIAASLVSQREGEDPRVREDRIARLLDDPDKLQEMRKQREAETRRRQAEERLRKGRYHSRGMSM